MSLFGRTFNRYFKDKLRQVPTQQGPPGLGLRKPEYLPVGSFRDAGASPSEVGSILYFFVCCDFMVHFFVHRDLTSKALWSLN